MGADSAPSAVSFSPRSNDPAPFTWQEFYRQWECACVDAWEAGKQEPAATLPLSVFPEGTAVQNPITGRFIEITRVSPFSWDTSRG